MTVFPQPKAPGMAVVPPCTHLNRQTFCFLNEKKIQIHTEIMNLTHVDQLIMDD